MKSNKGREPVGEGGQMTTKAKRAKEKEPVNTLIALTADEITMLLDYISKRPESEGLRKVAHKLTNGERIPPAWKGWTVIPTWQPGKSGLSADYQGRTITPQKLSEILYAIRGYTTEVFCSLELGNIEQALKSFGKLDELTLRLMIEARIKAKGMPDYKSGPF